MISVAAETMTKRVVAREVMRLPRSRPKPSAKDILLAWSQSRILKILDMTIRSHILRHTCFVLLKHGGEISTMQLVYHMQDFGYSSADTLYKFIQYIEKINLRYDLPISFHYAGRFIRLDASKI